MRAIANKPIADRIDSNSKVIEGRLALVGPLFAARVTDIVASPRSGESKELAA